MLSYLWTTFRLLITSRDDAELHYSLAQQYLLHAFIGPIASLLLITCRAWSTSLH